jgi:hypothetical protein
MREPRGARAARLTAIAIAAMCVWSTVVRGQESVQFVVSALAADGQPVANLTREDVLFSENGVANEIVKVEPLRIPVRLTIAVDNGPLSRDALSHYRSGLEGLVKALPHDVEVTLITTAPQPLRVVRPTTDRAQILKGINGFGPQDEAPRFTDSLVEFSKLYEEEFNKKKRFDSIPILVTISTTATEASSYEVPAVSKALTFLRARRARVYAVMLSVRQDVEAFAQINTNRQALIAIPAVKATGGKYEALAISNRLTTLLPEWGEELATLHRKYSSQSLVTAQRQEGLKGPLQNPRVELARPGINGEVSVDGLPQLTALQ